MVFFPLSILAGVVTAWLWPLRRALVLATALFGVAIVIAWTVQGFAPEGRDLVWLAFAWATTWASHRAAARRRSAST